VPGGLGELHGCVGRHGLDLGGGGARVRDQPESVDEVAEVADQVVDEAGRAAVDLNCPFHPGIDRTLVHRLPRHCFETLALPPF
jgi:hypothetical protein